MSSGGRKKKGNAANLQLACLLAITVSVRVFIPLVIHTLFHGNYGVPTPRGAVTAAAALSWPQVLPEVPRPVFWVQQMHEPLDQPQRKGAEKERPSGRQLLVSWDPNFKRFSRVMEHVVQRGINQSPRGKTHAASQKQVVPKDPRNQPGVSQQGQEPSDGS